MDIVDGEAHRDENAQEKGEKQALTAKPLSPDSVRRLKQLSDGDTLRNKSRHVLLVAVVRAGRAVGELRFARCRAVPLTTEIGTGTPETPRPAALAAS